jgi:FAD:protein FMN transferase
VTLTATARFPALGTTAVVCVADAAGLDAAVEAVRREVAAIDAACSRFRADSELTRLNAAGGAPVAASPLFLEALGVALATARATGGAVDPTVGRSLVGLGYDADFSLVAGSPPRTPEIVPAGRWCDVDVDTSRRLVSIPADVTLDLGSSAKALASDRAAAAAARDSGCGVLVGLGGDIAVTGAPPARGWSVRVTDDHSDLDGEGQTVAIRAGGLATSSTTVRRWRTDGGEVHHIVDPRTGRPAREVWRTVTVAAATCVQANAAATASVVRGWAAPAWLERLGLPARLVADDRVAYVGSWPQETP